MASKLRLSSLCGVCTSNSYNTTGNWLLCDSENGIGGTAAVALGCNNDFAYRAVGSRTQVNVGSQTYIGLYVIYTALDQKWPALGFNSSQAQQPTAVRTLRDQSAWMAEFRFHCNFYP